MLNFFTKQITKTEIILIIAGIVFFISTLYIANGGDLLANYIAKFIYILGTIFLIWKS